jgi:hypothetical protein
MCVCVRVSFFLSFFLSFCLSFFLSFCPSFFEPVAVLRKRRLTVLQVAASEHLSVSDTLWPESGVG